MTGSVGPERVMEAKLKHLEFIQGIVNRLATDSFRLNQLYGTSVTVVLVGSHTCDSRYVQYEIDQSKARGNGLLGIDVSKIKDLDKDKSERCGRVPEGCNFYYWNRDDGYHNMGDWIEKAAKDAGR